MGQFIAITVILFFALLRYIFEKYQEKKFDAMWDRKSFFFGKEFTRDTLMEAHVCLAGRMIKSDTKDAGQKVIYIHNYFRKKFPRSRYNFQEILTNYYSEPVSEKAVARWLNIHLRDRSKKMQVMYFLAGLSHVDGSIDSREMRLLVSISEILELTPKEFESVIGMYQQRYQRKSAPTSSSKSSRLKLACKVLGVSPQAGIDEIKKAYRSLVKIHHPDKFVNESEEQQEIAEQRFIEIQKAYEVVEKHK